MAYSDTTFQRSFNSASPGRLHGDLTRVLNCRSDEAMTPGLFGIRSGGSNEFPLVKKAVAANLTAKVVGATFAGLTTGDVITGTLKFRGRTIDLGSTLYATSPEATLGVAVTEANARVDTDFPSLASVLFALATLTINATAEVAGEDLEVSWQVVGTGTVGIPTISAGFGIFQPGSTSGYLGVIGDAAAYNEDGSDVIDDNQPISVAYSGPVDVLAVAAAYTANQTIYLNTATGGITGTAGASTVWIPPHVARVAEQAASTTARPQGAAVTLILGS
jgi:hypothetical protein